VLVLVVDEERFVLVEVVVLVLVVDEDRVVVDDTLLTEDELEDVLVDEDDVVDTVLLEDDAGDVVVDVLVDEKELLLVGVPPVFAEFTKLTKEFQSTPSFLYVAGSSVRYMDPYPVETNLVTNVLNAVPVVGME
jgi:hypothetical protein